MRNLRLFIIKNYFFFLFLIFQIVSLTLLINSNDFQRTSFLNSSNEVVGYILEKTTKFTEYVHLGDANDQLHSENAFLRNLLEDTRYEIHQGQVKVGDTSSVQQYYLLPAKVISNTVTMQDNYLTLNRGSLDGVKSGMGVSNGNAIVGFIKDVSPHFSTVISVLNKNFNQSVRLKKSKDFGSLIWEGFSSTHATVIDVPVDVKVVPGDTVITSGASLRFPENFFVGTVEKVEMKGEDNNHHYITVKLAANFNALYYVYVIDNKFASEQELLESNLQLAK